MIFEAKLSELTLKSINMKDKIENEIRIKKLRVFLMLIEIFGFVIVEVLLIRKYIFGIEELTVGYSPPTALIFYTVVKVSRLVVETYSMIVLALVLEFFIAKHLEKYRA